MSPHASDPSWGESGKPRPGVRALGLSPGGSAPWSTRLASLLRLILFICKVGIMIIPLAYKTVMDDYTSSSHQAVSYKGPAQCPLSDTAGGKWGPAMVWSLHLALGLELSDSRTEPFSASSPQCAGLGG